MRRLLVCLLSCVALVSSGCPGTTPSTGSSPAAPSERWVVGDVHVHSESANKANATSLSAADLSAELKAQGLEVAGVLTWGLRPKMTRLRVPVEGDGLILGTEVSDFGNGFPDHLLMFGDRDLLDFPRRLYTLPIVRWARKQGALVGVAHANHWSGSPGSYPVRYTQSPFEFPACIALGQEMFLCTEVLASQGFRVLWYGLLNCGFRVPLAGGSDWPVAGSHAGDTRTYVSVTGPLTGRAWLEGIRRGQTVVAQGKTDFALLKVGDAIPGAVLYRDAPGKVRVEILTSLAAPGVVDLLLNGRPAVRYTAPAGLTQQKATVNLTDSGWLALRTPNVHTGAITIEVGGRPVRASVEDAQYFLAYVDVLLKQIDAPEFAPQTYADRLEEVAKERKAARQDYSKARAVFAKIVAEAKARKN